MNRVSLPPAKNHFAEQWFLHSGFLQRADLGQSQLAEQHWLEGCTKLKRNRRKFWCNWVMTLSLIYDSTYLSLLPKWTVVVGNASNCLPPLREVTVTLDHQGTMLSTQASTHGFYPRSVSFLSLVSQHRGLHASNLF